MTGTTGLLGLLCLSRISGTVFPLETTFATACLFRISFFKDITPFVKTTNKKIMPFLSLSLKDVKHTSSCLMHTSVCA